LMEHQQLGEASPTTLTERPRTIGRRSYRPRAQLPMQRSCTRAPTTLPPQDQKRPGPPR
jgi:hypothetical protein